MAVHVHPYVRRILDGDIAPPPIAATLGGRIVSLDVEAGRIECTYVGASSFANPAGRIQGGMLGAMLDDVTALLVMASLDAGQHCATLNLNVSFLRPAEPGAIAGHATLVRRGSRICNVEGELRQNGKCVATASAVCMVAE
ncbi:PaaI family thioesterase [Burkholderia sp. PU8-34]